MKPIVLMGDSWINGPAAGQPSLAQVFTDEGVLNIAISAPTTAESLAVVENYIANGGTGSEFSMLVLNLGFHDMMNGVPVQETIANLNAIVADAASIGLKTEVITCPQVYFTNNVVSMPDPTHDAAFYSAVGGQHLEHTIGQMFQHFPEYAVAYQGPDYTNYAYSIDVPHPSYAGEVAWSVMLIAAYEQVQIPNCFNQANNLY